MKKVKNKRLFAGYYTKHDNSLIYVVTVVTDVDTGVESVIFHEGLEAYNTKFKSMTKESFCEMVEVDGEFVDKFNRKTDLKVTELHDLNIIDAGFNPPIRKPTKVSDEAYSERDFRWPELEIGKNSATPCSAPNKIACSTVIKRILAQKNWFVKSKKWKIYK